MLGAQALPESLQKAFDKILVEILEMLEKMKLYE